VALGSRIIYYASVVERKRLIPTVRSNYRMRFASRILGRQDLNTLINSIFPNLNDNMLNKDYITSRAILSTRNN
jgi:hypothetical protein